MLRVHPLELVHVKHTGALHNPTNVECLNQLITGEDFVISSIIPSQQCKVVDHGIREEPIQPKLITGCCPVTLGQLLLILSQDERAVCITRPGRTERIQNQSLTQRIGQVFLRANHGGNSHGGIVNGHAEVVNGYAARTKQDEVSNSRLGIPRDGATNGIIDDNTGAGGDLETHRVGISGRNFIGNQLRISITPRAIVAGWDALGLHFQFHLFQFFRCAEAGVGLTFVDEGLGEFGVNGGAF
mmetsp:Transcript_22575/g.38678  ORF Transcript_22575/g.38678 Transcript_22575/m.38678 type:complete len:242 (-) Transcript_22575:598-1323(-)